MCLSISSLLLFLLSLSLYLCAVYGWAPALFRANHDKNVIKCTLSRRVNYYYYHSRLGPRVRPNSRPSRPRASIMGRWWSIHPEEQAPEEGDEEEMELYLLDGTVVTVGDFESGPESFLPQPLPSAHLPTELGRTCALTLNNPGPHRMILQTVLQQSEEEEEAVAAENDGEENWMNDVMLIDTSDLVSLLSGDDMDYRNLGSSRPDLNRVYGHVAYKPQADTWVGAVGCATEILSALPTVGSNAESIMMMENGSTETFLCRGLFRFVVTDVIQTGPIPRARVKPWHDVPWPNPHRLFDQDAPEDENNNNDPVVDQQKLEVDSGKDTVIHEEDDEDEDEDEEEELWKLDYAKLTTPELVQRTMAAMKAGVDQQYRAAEQAIERSSFEQAVLPSPDMQQQLQQDALLQQAEIFAADYAVFQESLLDWFPRPQDRLYAVAFMAADLCHVDHQVRQTMVAMTDTVERLRLVLRHVERQVAMAHARQVAASLVTPFPEGSSGEATVASIQQDLQVGVPQLPSWAKSIRKNDQVEYWWNDEYGWCLGQIVEDPVLIVDEVVVTVYFATDGSTYKLPLNADEKARWRPPQRESASSAGDSDDPRPNLSSEGDDPPMLPDFS